MIERARVIGELCYLRPMEREDLTDEYLSWVNDTSTNAYIQAAGFPVNKEMLVQYFEASQPPDAVLFAVCDKKTHQHFGNARLSSIDWSLEWLAMADCLGISGFGAGIRYRSPDTSAKFGFHHLGLNRLWTGVVVENEASLKSNDRVGMTREGILRISCGRMDGFTMPCQSRC